jgi:putative membrane protein (TIGR04086 family)
MAADQGTRMPRRIIFAGANIAFGVSFIGLELLALLYGVSPAELPVNLNLLMIGINLLGGYAGGYLTAKNARGDALQNGTLTGVLAYIIQQIVHAALYGLGAVGNAFTTLALIGGAMAGAVLHESHIKRLSRIRASASRVEEGGSPGGLEGSEAGTKEVAEEEPEEKGETLP